MFNELTARRAEMGCWQMAGCPMGVVRKDMNASIAVCLVFLLLAGCSPEAPKSPQEAGKRLAGVKLRLVVVDDAAIAAAARGLKDEWNAQTGSEVEVSEANAKQAAEAIAGDAVICPSYLLGPLADAKRLAPVPPGIVRDPNGPWRQTFELLRDQESVWGKEVYGVSLGSPVFCCYFRADLLDKLHRKPPQTWKEYGELAALLREEGTKSLGVKYGTVEPLRRGWAGLVLLARAAAYAKERDNYTTLFDEKTFEPAIAGPPFVRALEELVAAAKLGPPNELEFDPAAARAEFWKGSTTMALTWPTGARTAAPGPASTKGAGVPPAGFAELPGGAEVYSPSSSSWEPRDDAAGQHVPLLGIAGRIGVVCAESPHADAAFELLLWLADPQWSSQVFAASPETTLFRRWQVASPKPWVESYVSATAARQYAEQTAETLSRRQFLASFRIPGRADYLAALDEAVHAAVRSEQTPAEALKTAAEKWRVISSRNGVERQRTAYMHSLGL